ncbi:tldc domain-containing protein [Stylonychia lemnae]|uniref:non-specific serine/threonine protein kinase n=1 Tax=Stylonychia lemnae TaxID=5949 RepID=A0A078B7I0_STYLE|nr:tldc domain-containing protein [Stylonychia lemnae]|eukprot:CDW90176.1 tldc domain-containing protein [Stylonychia lemnae]
MNGFGLKISNPDMKYRIEKLIGTGAFGQVYHASPLNEKQELIENMKVAFKQQDIHVFNSSATDLEKEDFMMRLLRLLREIATFQLKHPNIVEILDAFPTLENKFVIVSEFAEEGNLEMYVKKRLNQEKRKLSVSEISFIMLQLLEGLDYTHTCKFTHRDISPDNILVFDGLIVKICDFGIASYGTKTKLNAGKDDYKAPEICLNQAYDNKVDIWSLGVVLHYLMTGSDKLSGDRKVNTVLSNIQSLQLIQKIDLEEQYSEFQQIFNEMTSFQAEKRPTIQDLKEDFLQLIGFNNEYLAYQNYVMDYYFKQANSSFQSSMKQLQKYAEFHFRNVELKDSKAMQDNINGLLNDFDQYIETMQSFLTRKKEVKLDKNVANFRIVPSREEAKAVPLTTEEIPQKLEEYRRLVDQHINQSGDVNELVFRLNGQCQLLYKASSDTFKGNAFHQKCDNKGPTVAFILSEYGQIFGGYTSIPWKSPEGLYQQNSDGDAFIFQLTKRAKYTQSQNTGFAVGHQKNQILQFGMTDIFIKDNCDERRSSSANIGSTYQLPNGIQYGTQQCEQYLAGSKNFKVLEIEVYQVSRD